MKIQILLFTFLGLLLFACTEESPEDPLDVYREIAYSALSSSQKESILGDWKQAEVAAWTDGNYLVVFLTKDGMPPIRVVVNPETGRVVEILT
ncbi:MAG: hypothetical protein NWS90_03220 [Algoriphagus sp.]|jgi:hypothetical protein|uniref:hypothetical protein n=2 Tax=Algoriphagus sp. TaxID=1872435 RepID=UPI00276E9209|nr:hypothetical protein [Algoriphagus sp.]MDP4747808.1 hypothetical protein [Algoriphagus sp.]MDP4838170.1 hypothetical protein [Algoriphagus sp.]MDP4903372.1 hypothetical protein [Algoriphagus sp.]MDP4956622.1 hypothetical protein [Algoriphagus sp.]